MRIRIKPHLTYANVMSSIAVFAVLGGGAAWAHGKIGTSDIKKKAVTKPKIDNKAVTASKIARDSIKSAKIQDESLGYL